MGNEKEKLELKPLQGVSLILVNSEKGEQWIEQIKERMLVHEVSIERGFQEMDV